MTVRWLEGPVEPPVRWLDGNGQLGVTTNASQWGWRRNCLAACEQLCRDETGGVTVPYVTDFCKAKCYDDSGCENLAYGTQAEYDHAMAQLEAAADEAAYNTARARNPTEISSEAYPWKKAAPETLALQKTLNKRLLADGLCSIGEDGKLGPGTCGAAKHYGTAPANCLAFKAPAVCRTDVAPASSIPVVASSTETSNGKIWLVIGGFVIVAGAVYWWMR